MSGPTVLVVDDDQSILGTLAAFLTLEGFAVQTATNGVEALAAVAQERPAVVLLDMRMPVMDGWQFARELRARDDQIPIVVMTAAQDARQWAEEIGAASYVAKPIILSQLLARIDRIAA